MKIFFSVSTELAHLAAGVLPLDTEQDVRGKVDRMIVTAARALCVQHYETTSTSQHVLALLDIEDERGDDVLEFLNACTVFNASRRE